MSDLYSLEWVTAFNAAVTDLDLSSIPTGASLVADAGHFRVAYELREETTQVRVVLEAEGGTVRMIRDPDPGSSEKVDVTVSVSPADAAALASGELDPAAALGRGAIRVRGDVSVLVAGQAILQAAAARLAAWDLPTD